jgi:hypothetical protein
MIRPASLATVALVLVSFAGQIEAGDIGRKLEPSPADQVLVAGVGLARLKAALAAAGFVTRAGCLFHPEVLELACAGVLTSCNGNNATQPYMVASLPPVGYTPLENPPLGFFMRPDEAVLIVGRTPPPAAYFSFRSFILSRWVEREGVHRKVFVSLGDPANMLTMRTSAPPGGDPYGRAYVLLAVADEGVRDRVVETLRIAGYPRDIINIDSISPRLASLGLDEEANNELVLLHRLALWEPGYEEAGQAYIANPPAAVLRITPQVPIDPEELRPMPVDRLRPRGTGRTEMDLTPELDELRRSIVAAYPAYHADELQPAVWLEESFPALQRNVDVLGESRDTVYLRSEGSFTLAADEFLVVYGVNHEATEKATYANFAVYDACKACGVAGENSRHLAGSALDYVGGANPKTPHVDLMYAWKVARDCAGDPRCTTLKTGPCPGKAELETPLFVGFRAYVEPATKIGPAFTEILFDRVIRFTPAAPAISQAAVTPPVVTTPGAPATISFSVTNASGLDVTWTATLLPDDGCAALEPASGVVPGGNGDVTLNVSSPPGQRTQMTVVLEAKDAHGRRAAPRAVQPVFFLPQP